MRQQGALNWLKHDLTHRGPTAWALSSALLAFYIVLYWTDWLNPVAEALHLGQKWTLYGLLYTLAITVGGIHVIRKYRHNAYQVVRTMVVIFVQATLAFSIPLILKFFGQPEVYLSYLWPLKIEYFYPSTIASWPLPFIIWSVAGSLLMVPVLAVFFGKRWYCSWVCGCGGLANTAGDPWRHLSSKSSRAWAIEKYSVHITMVISFIVTAAVIASYIWGDVNPQLRHHAGQMQTWYGFVVVMILSGAVGVGLYPIGGTRIWCRYFCPMAAVLGLVQKTGKFRITVKDDMCISCGLCSTYCEMGIDVRAYAQRNEDFTRAACVGCGICEEVCPRGVLHLENSSVKLNLGGIHSPTASAASTNALSIHHPTATSNQTPTDAAPELTLRSLSEQTWKGPAL
ncbi:4Fe-4S dicluster domain-containing protein [Bradymonas sediminis]|uniref:4Fe-4S ferredoxin n=1 Tax=Bradymonas sediminis TaxID=1548548 RepID=A0A2Z4FQK3_9DELT|nr:4Fe-4S dicluster domain-containing protein [Bradymonas sediminis]AWV91361.1 4Fe-4S ferredoxin [Bradymonas sediminis]TDP71808.1 4Fe-4S binding protein [Bradymonas sediminis]